MTNRIVLNAGCGRTAEKEKSCLGGGGETRVIYLDIRDNVGADVIHDLNKLPLPFNDNYFDEILLSHVIGYLDNISIFLEDIHRILKPNGKLHIIVPHYTDWSYWREPEHKLHYSSYSFDRFQNIHNHHFDTKYPFKVQFVKITLQNVWKVLGIQLLLNASIKYKPIRFIRKFWEGYLCFIIRGVNIEVILKKV